MEKKLKIVLLTFFGKAYAEDLKARTNNNIIKQFFHIYNFPYGCVIHNLRHRNGIHYQKLSQLDNTA